MSKYRIKRSDLGSGAATAFNPNIIYIDVDALAANGCPEPDEDGVVINSNFIFKSGETAGSFYVTNSTLKINEDTVGDPDQEGFEIKAEASMPGDDIITKKFKKWALKRTFIILYQTCKGGAYEKMGSCCNPIRIKFGVEKDKDKTITKVMLTRLVNSDDSIEVYKGSIAFAEPTDVTAAAFAPTPANGYQYNIASSVTGALNPNPAAMEHGDVITLVGNGGATPATLSAGTKILLKEGTAWEALNDSAIHLKVFKDGTNVLLVEVNRS